MIKRVVESYHLQKDKAVARETNSVYTGLIIYEAKRYEIDSRLSMLGRFESSKHRSTLIWEKSYHVFKHNLKSKF